MNGYRHRQRSWWWWGLLIPGLAVLGFTAVLSARGEVHPTPLAMLVLTGATFLLTALMFVHLDVSDEMDRLRVRFGPLPLFGTSIPYEAMESVEPTTTGIWHGWGVHGLPGVLLVMNIAGTDAVCIRLKRRRGLMRARTVIVGTDDPDGLLGLLRSKLPDKGRHA